MAKRIGIGIAGVGTVGAGVVRTLRRNRAIIRGQAGADIVLRRVADLDSARLDALRIPTECRARDLRDLVADPDIQIIVELIGGCGAARDLVLSALEAGKHVVTANKALLAKHWCEVFSLAHRKGCAVGFEASVMAGVPIIRSLDRGLAGNAVHSIMGILNGTTNYILTLMAEQQAEFPAALEEARRRGMCEANAALDTEGHDAAQKLSILASISLNRWLAPDRVFREGIEHIEKTDILTARREFGYVLKPLAIFKNRRGGVEARVHPTFIPEDHPLAAVSHEFNAALIRTDTAGPITLIGKGAGELPAASGVVGDLVEVARALARPDGRVETLVSMPSQKTPRLLPVEGLESKFYLRFTVTDKPGVLSYIAGVLGRFGVSIARCDQQGRADKGGVPVIMITHSAREGCLRQALAEIDRARRTVKRKTVAIRIEE